jgi:VNT family MFS transporter (synaptic vesicle glycoprotein 2)
VYKHRAYYGSRKRRLLRSCCEIPLPLLALCIANSSDATEILMLSYLLADSRFREDMFSEDSSSSMEGAEYLASSIFVGMLIGGTVLGFLSDRIGRRPALLLGLLTNSVAGMCSSLPIFAPSFVSLTMWRFVAGVGIGATVPPLFTLASEWSSKEVRGVFVTAVASFWMVGSIFVSSLAWCLFQLDPMHELPIWRVFAATCALPSLLGAWMVYNYVPESPRFYLAAEKCDYELAAKSCNQMAMLLNVHLDHEKESTLLGAAFDHRAVHPLTKDELFSHHQENAANNFNSSENAHSPTNRAKMNQTINSSVDSLRKLYSSQLLPRTTLPLQLLWFCLSFATYGITTWINTLFVEIQLENVYFNSFLFALSSLPGNIVSMVYSDRYGRKKMLIGSLIGAACGLVVFATTVYAGSRQENDGQSNTLMQTFVIVLCACAFQAFGTISWNTIDIITAEMFPTNVRSAGMGVCTATGRLGGILSQCVNAKLIVDGSGSGAAWILVVASISLLFGAGMPLVLDRDMTMEELRDDAIEDSTDCCCSRKRKDHLSDEETDMPQLQLQSSRSLEYQSFQQEVESNQPFLL